MKILKLSARNVKRLRAVEITPDGNVVVVSGRNGQGKSSVLDSIMYALGGKDVACSEPIRRGEESAEVTCDLGDLVVRRAFFADGNSTLTVESKEGAHYTKPQTRLDGLLGALSFDPLEFSRMKPDDQAVTLRSLAGLDFAELEGQRLRLFNQRTEVNRDGNAVRARFDALPDHHENAPAAEVSSDFVIQQIEEARETQKAIDGARLGAREATRQAEYMKSSCENGHRRVEDLQKQLEAARAELDRMHVDYDKAKVAASYATAYAQDPDIDLGPLKERLAGVQDANRRFIENRTRAAHEKELNDLRDASLGITRQIAAIDAKKQAAIAAARFPVDGLGFGTEGGVTFCELPFDQASSAEKLRVSVAIGMALNPKIRVLLIRDGSLLDAESLRLVAEMAETQDAQLWIERVEDGGATVVIEDGAVQQATAAVES